MATSGDGDVHREARFKQDSRDSSKKQATRCPWYLHSSCGAVIFRDAKDTSTAYHPTLQIHWTNTRYRRKFNSSEERKIHRNIPPPATVGHSSAITVYYSTHHQIHIHWLHHHLDHRSHIATFQVI